MDVTSEPLIGDHKSASVLQPFRYYAALLSCSSAGSTRDRPLETGLSLERVYTEAPGMSFLLLDTKSDQAAGDVMPLSPPRARLTAAQAELIRTDPNRFFNLCTDMIHPSHLVSRQGQVIGRIGPWRRI